MKQENDRIRENQAAIYGLEEARRIWSFGLPPFAIPKKNGNHVRRVLLTNRLGNIPTNPIPAQVVPRVWDNLHVFPTLRTGDFTWIVRAQPAGKYVTWMDVKPQFSRIASAVRPSRPWRIDHMWESSSEPEDDDVNSAVAETRTTRSSRPCTKILTFGRARNGVRTKFGRKEARSPFYAGTVRHFYQRRARCKETTEYPSIVRAGAFIETLSAKAKKVYLLAALTHDDEYVAEFGKWLKEHNSAEYKRQIPTVLTRSLYPSHSGDRALHSIQNPQV